MCSGFKVLVDCCHVKHHALPIRSLSPDHFVNVLAEKKKPGQNPRSPPGPFQQSPPDSYMGPCTGWGLGLWAKPDHTHQRPGQDACSITTKCACEMSARCPSPTPESHTGAPLLPATALQGWLLSFWGLVPCLPPLNPSTRWPPRALLTLVPLLRESLWAQGSQNSTFQCPSPWQPSEIIRHCSLTVSCRMSVIWEMPEDETQDWDTGLGGPKRDPLLLKNIHDFPGQPCSRALL